MAVRTIVKKDLEFLSKKSRKVVDFDKRLHDLLEDMAHTMYGAGGVGLAAPQVGVLKRVVVIDVGQGLIELVNPIIESTKGMQIGTEGCLSFPEEIAEVKRPMQVTVKAVDRFGKPIQVTGKEMLARAFCHEIDHLNGVLFKDLATKIYTPEDIKKMSEKKQ